MRAIVWACVAACGLVGGAARAEFFQYQGVGTLGVIGTPPGGVEFQFDAPVIGQIGGFGFTGFSGTAIQTFSNPPEDPDDVTGMGMLVGSTPADTLTVTFHGLAFGANPGSASVAASATFDGGTGAFAGLSGVGDLSAWVVFTSAFGGTVGITLQGELVPSPGAAGMLVGAMALASLRRRR